MSRKNRKSRRAEFNENQESQGREDKRAMKREGLDTTPQDTVPYFKRKPIRPQNKKQAEYITAITNSVITCSTGVSGSGKSYIAATMAADMLSDPSTNINKIIIARPCEMEGTKSIGLLPGTINEKMAPLVAPVADCLKSRLGETRYKYLLEKGDIELLPLEYIKGRTFNNVFVLIDESEDIEWSVLKALLLRTGRNCKIVLNGDLRQTAISGTSGLAILWKIMEEHHLPVQHIDFDNWDYCVRSEECRIFGQVFEQAGY